MGALEAHLESESKRNFAICVTVQVGSKALVKKASPVPLVNSMVRIQISTRAAQGVLRRAVFPITERPAQLKPDLVASIAGRLLTI